MKGLRGKQSSFVGKGRCRSGSILEKIFLLETPVCLLELSQGAYVSWGCRNTSSQTGGLE